MTQWLWPAPRTMPLKKHQYRKRKEKRTPPSLLLSIFCVGLCLCLLSVSVCLFVHQLVLRTSLSFTFAFGWYWHGLASSTKVKNILTRGIAVYSLTFICVFLCKNHKDLLCKKLFHSARLPLTTALASLFSLSSFL
jgi:hypothetical protein